MSDDTHTVLTCGAKLSRFGYRCSAILAVLPGDWEVTRQLGPSEKAGHGRGSVVCRKDGCRAKWEIGPAVEMRKAA